MLDRFMHIMLTLLFAGLPLLIIFVKKRRTLIKNIDTLLIVLMFLIIYGLLMDNVAVWLGVWSFIDGHYTGIRIPIMPIDDLIFGIFVQLLVSSVTIVHIENLNNGIDKSGL